MAGVILLDLLALKRKVAYDRRKTAKNSGQTYNRGTIAQEVRETTMEKWQRRYKTDSRGRWTARLMPRVQAWIERSHEEVNYFLT